MLNYVDDALIFNKRLAHVEAFRDELAQRFDITVDKRLTRYLGLDIVRTKYGFELSQQRLVSGQLDLRAGQALHRQVQRPASLTRSPDQVPTIEEAHTAGFA